MPRARQYPRLSAVAVQTWIDTEVWAALSKALQDVGMSKQDFVNFALYHTARAYNLIEAIPVLEAQDGLTDTFLKIK